MLSHATLPRSRQSSPGLSSNAKTPALQALEPLIQWTTEQDLPEWDILLIGDGSGSKWEIGAGWGCTLVERASGQRTVFCGGMNLGTVPIAEIMPYIHALLWYSAELDKRQLARRKTRVLIICDNKPLVIQGQQLTRGARTPTSLESNRTLWRALIGFQQEGFSLHFHWLPRVTLALNRYADTLASAARIAVNTLPLPAHTRTKCTLDVYQINVDEHVPLMPYKPPKKTRKRRDDSQRERNSTTRRRRAAGDRSVRSAAAEPE